MRWKGEIFADRIVLRETRKVRVHPGTRYLVGTEYVGNLDPQTQSYQGPASVGEKVWGTFQITTTPKQISRLQKIAADAVKENK